MPSRKVEMQKLLTKVIETEGSDLHVSVGKPPAIRVAGSLYYLEEYPVISPEQSKELIFSILSELQVKTLEEEKEIDFAYTLNEDARFRVNVFHRMGSIAGAFRLINNKIRSLQELGIDEQLSALSETRQGLILVVGPAGHGKSTTIASFLQMINTKRREHILTIEDPIEYIFQAEKSIINQREIFRDTLDFQRALKSCLREDINVLMLGEMRDLESISSALTLAETGHVIYSTLHTNDAVQTIDRIIDSFPPHQQSQIRLQLSNVLVAVIAQRLIPDVENSRSLAYEVLISNPAIKNLIREGNTHQIRGVLQTSRNAGMQTLERSLAKLVGDGKITIDSARAYSIVKEDLDNYLAEYQ